MQARPSIYLTNTLTRNVEEFTPLVPGEVSMYTCGPTVYSYAHIGNFRAFLMADTLRRVFEYNGYKVKQVRNITDVGHLTNDTLSTGADKIEEMARREQVTPWDIARHFTDAFLEDTKRLDMEEPACMPRATQYIPQMIGLIERLIEREYAYEARGNVYFDVTRFPRYGALSGNTVDGLIAGHRVEVGEGKRNPADFALWKAAGPDKLMRWPSPWSEGVPGWHIECSAMSMALLGDKIDVHTGGIDNIFPHHEDEIAQSEAATGEPFVRYWVHSAWLQASDQEKMSKSLGNIYTIAELADQGVHPLAYRYFTMQAHYRTPLNFSWEALEASQTALRGIWEQLAEMVQSAEPGEMSQAAENLRAQFHARINQDMDMPGALAVIHEALRSKLPAEQTLALFEDFDRVLGLCFVPRARELSLVSEAERHLLRERALARESKNWATSDELRTRLVSGGLDVKDTPAGQRWVRRDS